MKINTLYNSARQGDRTAEEELFTYLTVRFRLFARQRIRNESDMEEIVQDALMTILNKYKDTEITGSFSAWVYGVLNNKIMSHVTKNRARTEILARVSDTAREHAARQPNPSLETRLLQCLKKIDKVHRQHARILNLHHQGYTTEEICGKLKISPNNFYVILSRARSMLELCLEKGDIK